MYRVRNYIGFLCISFSLILGANEKVEVELINAKTQKPIIYKKNDIINENVTIDIIVNDQDIEIQPPITLKKKKKNIYTLSLSALNKAKFKSGDKIIEIFFTVEDKSSESYETLVSKLEFSSSQLRDWFKGSVSTQMVREINRKSSAKIKNTDKKVKRFGVEVNSPVAQISGTVINQRGERLDGVDINFNDQTDSKFKPPPGRMKTDQNGFFQNKRLQLRKMIIGEPYIILRKKGYELKVVELGRENVMLGKKIELGKITLKKINNFVYCESSDLEPDYDCNTCSCIDKNLVYYENKLVCDKQCEDGEDEIWTVNASNREVLKCVPRYEMFTKGQGRTAWGHATSMGFPEEYSTVIIKHPAGEEKLSIGEGASLSSIRSDFIAIFSRINSSGKNIFLDFSNDIEMFDECESDIYFRISFTDNGKSISRDINIFDIGDSPALGVRKGDAFAIQSGGSNYLSRNFFYSYVVREDMDNPEKSFEDEYYKIPQALSSLEPCDGCECYDIEAPEDGSCDKALCLDIESYADHPDYSDCTEFFVLDENSDYYRGIDAGISAEYNGEIYPLQLSIDDKNPATGESVCGCSYAGYTCDLSDGSFECIPSCLFDDELEISGDDKNLEREKKKLELDSRAIKIRTDVCMDINPNLYSRYVKTCDWEKGMGDNLLEKYKNEFSDYRAEAERWNNLIEGTESTWKINLEKYKTSSNDLDRYQRYINNFSIPEYPLDNLDIYLSQCGELVFENFDVLDQIARMVKKEVDGIIDVDIDEYFRRVYFPRDSKRGAYSFGDRIGKKYIDESLFMDGEGVFNDFFVHIADNDVLDDRPGITVLELLDAIYQKMKYAAETKATQESLSGQYYTRMATFYWNSASFYRTYFTLLYLYEYTDNSGKIDGKPIVKRGYSTINNNMLNELLDPQSYEGSFSWSDLTKNICDKAIDSFTRYNLYADKAESSLSFKKENTVEIIKELKRYRKDIE